MAMGRQKDGQGDLMVSWSEMPRSPGHVFYDRLQSVLIEGGFDAFAEASCRPYYAARMGAPSVPPGRYFRMHLVGYFEGIDSERGLEWRCSDSLSLRAFLRLGSRDRVPDHSWLSRSRTRVSHEVHAAVFDWGLVLIAEAGLIKGERIGVDASTMEANAALRNIVRRDNGEGYREMLERLAGESGVETPTAEDLAHLERKRKKLSNTDWVSKSDPDAKIAKMKDGTTHLAYKPEHAVDLDTGAVVAAELHPADEGDTTTLSKTLTKAEANLEAVDAAPTLENPAECVADKGYHSRAVLRALNDSPWKTRIAAPKQTGFSRWHGDEAARRAVTNNRARLKSGVAREAFKLRAEIVERCFAHNLDRGGMRRTWLRGRENVHKRYLLHVAGHNLSLLMRQLIGAGTPREAVAGGDGGIFVLLTPTGAMLVARGGLAKRPDGFRRRIPHLGVRAGKSHLINGLFGGINLEDISAPACFEIEARLRERMNIPVFHDDQHGTAIVVGAAIWNALKVVGKKIEDVRLVASGAGAAALACLDLLVSLGVRPENITVTDKSGVIHKGRAEDMDKYKARYAQDTDARKLAEAIDGADIFLGLSAPGALKPAMVKKMAKAPIIMALANPTPEIMPDVARKARPDAIIATGRSDYPNQVNNVLCFPFLFRGALDVGATTINEEMKVACVKALADLAEAETSEVVQAAFGGQATTFGPEKLIPKPFDPRLIVQIAPAVAKAAMDSGVATRPIEDFEQYRERLSQFVFRSGLLVKPLFDGAREAPKRVVYAEGEDERVLRAIQIVIDDGLANPIIIGRRFVVEQRMERLGLRARIDKDFEFCDPQDDPRYREYWSLYHELMARRGVSPDVAREVVRTSPTVIAALMLKRGEVDASICGATGRYHVHLKHVLDVIGRREGVDDVSALTALVLANGTYFLADTHVSPAPTTGEIVELALLAADSVRRFGTEPKLALLSHSNFGSSDTETSLKMRQATAILQRDHPELEVEGEMHADAALDERIRKRAYPETELKGSANLLIMPTLDASNIAFNLMKVLGEGLSVGPMLIGMAQPAHVLATSVTARGIVNMTAFAVVDAQAHEETAAG